MIHISITIKEIAKVAGVSRGTVDRALHNRKGINEDSANRIKHIAKSLGYSPNKAGKMLASNKKPIKIACLLPSIDNEFFDDVIKGFKLAEEELKDFGVSVIIKKTKGYNVNTHMKAIQEVLSENISALCVSTIDVPKIRDYINEICELGIPVITVNSDVSFTKRLCYIGTDYIVSGETAGGILSQLRIDDMKILIVTGSLSMKGHNERIKGFLNILDKKHMSYELLRIFESNDDINIAYSLTIEHLTLYKDTNVIFITAAGVAGVCKAVVELGRQDDIVIISYDDVPSTKKYVKSGVINFTICQDPVAQGKQPVNILFNYFISGDKKRVKNYFTKNVIKISENI